MQNILDQIRTYINTKQSAVTWTAGKDFVNYAGPYFTADEYVSTAETLLNGWLVMGEKSAKFETEFPKQFSKKNGILTNSGSSANLLMLASLTSKRGHNFPRGTKVLMPVAGFPTTLNPTLQLGFDPVFVDIEIDTLNLDLSKAEELIKQHGIKVITFAHVLGNPPNMDQVMELVNKYNLVLLEDCCDALGSTYDGRALGSYGEMSSCSFYPAHHISLAEGGFVACQTAEQETILRSFRDWGRGCFCSTAEIAKSSCGQCGCRFSNWIPELPDEVFDHKYIYDEIGFNLKPIEMQGAMGLEQLKKIPEIVSLRKRNYQLLFSIFEKYEEFFHLPRARDKSDPSWFAFPLTIRAGAPFKREHLIEYLEDNLIQTRPYFAGNLLLQPAYNHLMNGAEARDNFPVATHVMMNTFFLGTSPVITPEQIAYIGSKVDGFLSLYL